MVTMRKKNRANAEIRALIEDKGINYYQAAVACGVSNSTLSRWLALELPKEKKKEIMAAISQAQF